MNYHDNEDELLRMQARRKRPQPSGKRPSRSRTASHDNCSFRERESFDSIDDAYFEDEYGYEDGLDIPFSDERPAGTAKASKNMASRSSDMYISKRTAVSSASKRSTSQGRSSRSGKGAAFPSKPSREAQSRSRNEFKAEEKYCRSPKGSSVRERRRKKKKKWPMLLIFLLLAVTAYGSFLYLHRPTGVWTVAVFGVDSRDGNTKKALADVQMVCTLDRETGEIRLASVFRDTYLKIDSKGTYHKINEAYFKGGQKQAVAALEENLDLKIDDYAAFNWKAVAEAINVLGGIDLEITPAEFKYINGFITETVNSTGIGSTQLKQAGPNHLDGVQAVAYSRLRLMDTDFQRTERQRRVIALTLEKARQADAGTLTSLAKAILPQISASIGIDDVLPLVKDISKYYIADTAGFPFSRETKRVGKMDCVIATTLESNVIQLHQFLYGEDTLYHPSSGLKKISAHISEETGLYEEGKPAPSKSSSGSPKADSKDKAGGTDALKTTEASKLQETVPETSAKETEKEEESSSLEETKETISIKENEKETKEEKGPGVSGPGSSKESEAEKESRPLENSPSEDEDISGSLGGTGSTGPGASSDQQPGGGPGISALPGASKETKTEESVSIQGPGA